MFHQSTVTGTPEIRVTRHEGHYFALDNRRLAVFRLLQLCGQLGEVVVSVVPVEQVRSELDAKFADGGCGRTVVVEHWEVFFSTCHPILPFVQAIWFLQGFVKIKRENPVWLRVRIFVPMVQHLERALMFFASHL